MKMEIVAGAQAVWWQLPLHSYLTTSVASKDLFTTKPAAYSVLYAYVYLEKISRSLDQWQQDEDDLDINNRSKVLIVKSNF